MEEKLRGDWGASKPRAGGGSTRSPPPPRPSGDLGAEGRGAVLARRRWMPLRRETKRIAVADRGGSQSPEEWSAEAMPNWGFGHCSFLGHRPRPLGIHSSSSRGRPPVTTISPNLCGRMAYGLGPQQAQGPNREGQATPGQS